MRANVIENFFNSPEFQGVGSPVARLYFATFLRIPDYAGLLFQIDAFRSGTPLSVIANNFTASPEFLATNCSATLGKRPKFSTCSTPAMNCSIWISNR